MAEEIELHLYDDPNTLDLCNAEAVTSGIAYTIKVTFPPTRNVDVSSLQLIVYGNGSSSVAACPRFSKDASGVNTFTGALFISSGQVASYFPAPGALVPFRCVVQDSVFGVHTDAALTVALGENTVDPADPYDLVAQVQELARRVTVLEGKLIQYIAGTGISITEEGKISVTHDLAASLRTAPQISTSSSVQDLIAVISTLQATASKGTE